MAFSASGKDFTLEGSILRGELADVDGNYQSAAIDLNECIGNEDGWFMWDAENFSESAHDVRLEVDGSSVKLVANLTKRDGGYRELQGIDLNDRISNENGSFVFQ
jgi:hypothetical protein